MCLAIETIDPGVHSNQRANLSAEHDDDHPLKKGLTNFKKLIPHNVVLLSLTLGKQNGVLALVDTFM